MRNTKNNQIQKLQQPARVTTSKEDRVLRALWRILASRGQRPAEAEAEVPRDKDAQAELEWHLRMMS